MRRPHGCPAAALSPKTCWPAVGPFRASAGVADARSPIRKRWRSATAYARNIENFIGTVKVPVGLAGPLRVNGAARAAATTTCRWRRPRRRWSRRTPAARSCITEAGGCAAVAAERRASAARRASPSTRSPRRRRSSRWASRHRSRPFASGGRGDDAPRQARRHAADRRRQPRLPRLRVHDRRRLRPEHGDDRHRGDLPLHRGSTRRSSRGTGSSRRTCRATRRPRRSRS